MPCNRPQPINPGDLRHRNSFITVAERELMLPPSLTKRLVNHARPNDVTQGYAADWTIAPASRARAENRRSDRSTDVRRTHCVAHRPQRPSQIHRPNWTPN